MGSYKSDEMCSIVSRFNECINNRDITGLGELMAPDHTFIDRAGTIVRGKKTMVANWTEFFVRFPEYRNTFLKVVSQGDLVVAVGFARWSRHGEPDRVIWTARICHGLVAEWRIDEDTLENRALLVPDSCP